MSKLMNPFAPDVRTALSPEAEEQVARYRSGDTSPFACKDAMAIRRVAGHDQDTPLRPSFVRDTEKILHMPAYNRLAGKTQVFSFRANDDLCRRGLHVQLVSRVARDIGRALGLNLDLIDAIALGHDIGHTPFGHTGERYLNERYHARTGRWFFHNVQSVRVLDVLGWRNLSLQTLDGVICHNGEFEQQVFETSDLKSFEAFDQVVERCWAEGDKAISRLRPMTLEGCCVRVADIIAYVGKDRQDAIRAGICKEDAFDDGLGGAYNTWALSALVTDIVEHSLGKDRLQMGEQAFAEMARAKRENYQKIYGASEVNGNFSAEFGEVFSMMYDQVLQDLRDGREEAPVFRHHVRMVTEWLSYYGRTYQWQDDLDLTTVDYLSSMTDDYFVAYARALFPEKEAIFPSYTHF
ncbi:MAG: HD domain-containing protein [Coriobacteriales bacterium]|jgi:dGTPase|nr:HD domain-containing protein [Coriobacteriales bacterium]